MAQALRVTINEALYRDVERFRKRRGMSRSEAVEYLLMLGLQATSKKEAEEYARATG